MVSNGFFTLGEPKVEKKRGRGTRGRRGYKQELVVGIWMARLSSWLTVDFGWFGFLPLIWMFNFGCFVVMSLSVATDKYF